MIDTNGKLNVSLDLGHLLVYDNQPFNKDYINEDDIISRGKSNLKQIFGDLFKLSNTQKGENEDNRDFDKPEDNVMLPKPITVLTRAKPIPKPKPLTKWEKYKQEKGLPTREKRSRMVYSETAGDWVPSAKQIEEKTEWAIEEKPEMNGKNPFELRKQEKKLGKMKQMKNEMKNEEARRTGKAAKTGKGPKSEAAEGGNDNGASGFEKKKNRKFDQMEKANNRLKNDKKGLEKTLETVQRSTASVGKFDKKMKNEKEANPIKKKNVDPSMFLSRKQERDRNSRILSNIIGNK